MVSPLVWRMDYFSLEGRAAFQSFIYIAENERLQVAENVRC